MPLAQLSIDLTAKIASFEKELKRSADIAETQAQKIQAIMGMANKAIAGLGAGLTAAAFTNAIKSSIDYADEMSKLAQRAGVATESISALAYAAKLSDVDQEQLAQGLGKLAEEAGKGGDKLKKLGISVLDTSGQVKSADVLFSELADKFASMPDGINKTNAAIRIFGDGVGSRMIPLLNSGASGLRDAADEAARFGQIVSTDAGKAAENFNDNLTRLHALSTGVANEIARKLVPSLADMSEEFLVGMKHANGFIDAIITFGTINPFKSQVSNLASLREEIAGLEADRVRYQRANADTTAIDQALDKSRRQLEYLKEIQRIQALRNKVDGGDAVERKYLRAPAQDTSLIDFSNSKAKKSAIDESATALAGYVNQLQSAIDRTRDLTEVERAREFLRSQGAAGEISQVQELVLGMAKQLDAAEKLKKSEQDRQELIRAHRQIAIDELEAIDRANGEYQQLMKSLLDATPTAQLERQRDVMAMLAKEYENGRISAEQFGEAAQTYLGNVAKKADETKDIAKELGLTFSSAFEDAIVGGKSVSDMLKGLAQDVARIVVRKSITEPLGNALTGFLGGLKFPSFDGGGYTGFGSRSGGLDGKGGYLAMLHPRETVTDHTKPGGATGGSVVLQQHFYFDGSSDRSTVMTAAQLGSAMAQQSIRDQLSRGRL